MKPNKKYIRDFSDPNPRIYIVAFLILAAFLLPLLGHLQESEKIHCKLTATNKSLCR